MTMHVPPATGSRLAAWCLLAWPATIMPLVLRAQYWTELSIEAPLEITSDGRFGGALDLDDDLLLVGAPGNNGGAPASGSAYIHYRFEGGLDEWGQVKHLAPPVVVPGAAFGHAVLLRGDLAFVSAPVDLHAGIPTGVIHIFQRDLGGSDNWGLLQTVAPDSLEWWMSFGDRFVFRDGYLFVSCPGYDEDGTDGIAGMGAIAIFQQQNDATFEPVRFVRGDVFVDTVLTGPGYRPCVSGWFDVFQGGFYHVSDERVFHLPVEVLADPDADPPTPVEMLVPDAFGADTSGAWFFNGAAGVDLLLLGLHAPLSSVVPRMISYSHDPDGEPLVHGQFHPDPAVEPDFWEWGTAVDLRGPRAIAGAFGHQTFVPLGHAEVHQLDPGALEQWSRIAYLAPADAHFGDQFGRSVAMGDDVAVVGAPGFGGTNTGKVYIFTDPFAGLNGGGKEQAAPFLCPNPAQNGSAIHFCSPMGEQSGTIRFCSMDGRQVLETFVHASGPIDTGRLANGNYIWTWSDEDRGTPLITGRVSILP